MTELIDRYVHQVGRYLSRRERVEIEAELRSQIHDQLEDRYGTSPSEAEIVTVLTELGDPRQIAISYSGERYLVGPTLYPTMMMILRHGWLLVPAVVIFLNLFGVLTAPESRTFLDALAETVIAVVQAVLIFSAVVVLFFAILQHSGKEFDEQPMPFSPLKLPDINDPSVVDRAEATFGTAFGTVVSLLLLYFLSVGGLTLRFNLSDPGEVIPSPLPWLIALIITGISMIVLNLLALRRNRWNAALWLTQIVLDVFGTICLYFAVIKPLFERVLADNPTLNSSLPILSSVPEIITVGYAVITLLSQGSRLIQLWNYGHSH
jgi:hypothetical protein